MLILIAAQICALETAISELIAADRLWQKFNQAFRSLKGVADRTVARLMAELPEVGTLSNKGVSKLAGLDSDGSIRQQEPRQTRRARGSKRHPRHFVRGCRSGAVIRFRRVSPMAAQRRKTEEGHPHCPGA
jgi:hypothetical protein